MQPLADLPPDALMACAQCDALHRNPTLADGETARCVRCHTVLLAPRAGAARTIVSLASAALVLMAVAISFPFLRIEASGLHSEASVIDAVLAFSESSFLMIPLSATVAAMIIMLPVLRLVALIYALVPVLLNRPPPRHAASMFRMAMRLRPWAMAEIFVIGVAVALIKIAGLATVDLGPAFWAFTGLVLLVAVQDVQLCERSLWRQMETKPRS